MILTCPECATSYFVDDSRISPKGRTVKCSNCGARWTALPEGAVAPAPRPTPAPPPRPAPPPPPVVDELVVEGPETFAPPVIERRRPAASAKRPGGGKVWIWVASAAVVAVVIAAAILFRDQVVRLMPASRAAYAGLGVPAASLVIEQVKAETDFQGGRPALSVTGQLRNVRDVATEAPPLRVSLLDRAGKTVAAKVARPLDAAVPAHAVRHFAISIVDPPAQAHDLEVSFAFGGPGFEKGGGGKGATAALPVAAPAPAASGPAPVEAKPLPPGSPDALPAPL
ncbi:DUF3426 domain-containing protein [Phenylobacterium sp.]|uniref:DUF3426 domain-containing protein n=1 Tax=Phenylobacterium sp. TaxID=1871053 RepID=UPI0025CBE3BE|nr:DUF3426 domain-containing protein [Phenylobacterium sp.]